MIPDKQQIESVQRLLGRMSGVPSNPQQEEEREKLKLSDSASMLEAWRSEGGLKIQEWLKGLRETYTLDPRYFLKRSEDGTTSVDQFLVASVASACTVIDDVFRRMERCAKAVENAGKDKGDG